MSVWVGFLLLGLVICGAGIVQNDIWTAVLGAFGAGMHTVISVVEWVRKSESARGQS